MSYYWSLSNGNISEFLVNTQAYVLRLYHYQNLDERTILTTLAGNRYYICGAAGTQKVPYGYRKIEEREGCVIYENENALPLGYCYDSYVTETEAAAWNGAQREEAMAQNVILCDDADGINKLSGQESVLSDTGIAECKKGQPFFSGREIALHVVEMSEGVATAEQGFKVRKKGATVVLEAERICDAAENYLCMEGFEY